MAFFDGFRRTPPWLAQSAARGASLRNRLAGADGVVPSAALTDGVELLLDRPTRLVFTDTAQSDALFGLDAPDAVSAYSDLAPIEGGGDPGGVIVLRAGMAARLSDGDPAARFALAHEIGHRVWADPAPPRFSERTLSEIGLFATHRSPKRAPSATMLAELSGEPVAQPAEAPDMVVREARANAFAFWFLTDPQSFRKGDDDLIAWCANRGAPLIAAQAWLAAAPELFGGSDPAR